MKIIKSIISIFLLLTYAFGGGHTLAPHCQALVAGEYQTPHHHHKHDQHQPGEEENTDHNHIKHYSHFDAGVYDLILCFLSEMEHPANDCNISHYLPSRTDDNLKEPSKTKLVAVLLTLLRFTEQIETLPDYSSEDFAIYLSPPIDNSPHRGPPSISC